MWCRIYYGYYFTLHSYPPFPLLSTSFLFSCVLFYYFRALFYSKHFTQTKKLLKTVFHCNNHAIRLFSNDLWKKWLDEVLWLFWWISWNSFYANIVKRHCIAITLQTVSEFHKSKFSIEIVGGVILKLKLAHFQMWICAFEKWAI